jgi:hypothetical protein
MFGRVSTGARSIPYDPLMVPVRSPAVAVLGLLACGRTELLAPPLDACTTDTTSPTHAGCSFFAARGVHGVQGLSQAAGLPLDRWEPDAVFVVNPNDHELLLDVLDLEDGAAEVERPERLALDPGERRKIGLRKATMPDATHRRTGGLVRIDGDAPFLATLHTPQRPFFGNDSALLLPIEALGETYVVASYPALHNHFQGIGEPSFFEVIAAHDATEIRWLPLGAATDADGAGIDAVAAGEWSRTLVLDRHEAARITAAITGGNDPGRSDLSGTIVEASAPIRIVSGTRCSAVPMSQDSGEGCDPLSDQLLPVDLWGTRYAIPHPPLRTYEQHYYRIYAGADGVSITTEPSVLVSQPTVLVRRGEYVDVVVEHGTSFAVEADGPIMPVGYLATRDEDVEIGDPAMYQHVPTDRFLDAYRVTTGTEWEREMLVVVRPLGGSDVSVDGESVDGWETFGAWETTVVDVDEGAHVVESDDPFGLTQIGWTNVLHDSCVPLGRFGTCQTSYAHPAGLRR